MGNKQTKQNKQTLLSEFDTRVSGWNLITNTKNLNNRLINYKTFIQLNVNNHCVCRPSSFFIKKEENKCNLEVKKRIGSESIAGYVFELKSVNKLKMAAKIIPNELTTIDEITNEIKIATYLSSLVLTNQTIYFPIVYGVYECDNTIYSSLLKILNNNILSKIIYKHIIKTFNKDIVKNINNLNNQYNSLSIKQFLTNIKQITKKNISIDDIVISSTILISELAWGDLRQYTKQKNIESQLIFLLHHIIKAIIVFQQHNIIHNDLHTGNILILMDDKKTLLPLIHDFGTSNIILSDMTFNEKIIDINNLIYVLTKEIKNKKYLKLNKIIENILKIISKNKKNLNIMNIIDEQYLTL
jgi:serine/threonine protein kinase